MFFFFQAEDGIRDRSPSRGLGDVYKRQIREGASPRAAQALIRTARARAFMENRLNVSFEDVKCVALPVLRHRILLSFDAVSEGITEDAVIGQILTEKEQGLYA